MPRRTAGTLLPLELDILEAALTRWREGQPTFHGYGIANALRVEGRSRSLTAHGTLYKALGRLEEAGLLTSRWEDPTPAEGRPRRRLYQLTGPGAEAATAWRDDLVRDAPRVAREPA